MSEQITNDQYTHAMFTLQHYIRQQTKPVDLECLQNILLSMMQDINRQIIKCKEYERMQAECDKEIEKHQIRRNSL